VTHDPRRIEQGRKAAVKMALALGMVAVLFYIGFILTRL
jgi:hypothetical protein